MGQCIMIMIVFFLVCPYSIFLPHHLPFIIFINWKPPIEQTKQVPNHFGCSLFSVFPSLVLLCLCSDFLGRVTSFFSVKALFLFEASTLGEMYADTEILFPYFQNFSQEAQQLEEYCKTQKSCASMVPFSSISL